MPTFEDLPAVVLPAMDDAVTRDPGSEAALEGFETPTVHEVMEHAEAEDEGGASDPPVPNPGEPPLAEAAHPAPQHETFEPPSLRDTDAAGAVPAEPPVEAPPLGSTPPGSPSPGRAAQAEPAAEAGGGAGPGAVAPSARAGGREARGTDPGVEHDAGFDIDLPLGEDEFWEEGEEPPEGTQQPSSQPASGGSPGDRRVVVIDEDAEFATPRPGPATTGQPTTGQAPTGQAPGGSTPPRSGVARIGATLEEDDAPKRRWRLFRKGGA
jgi:hypothetical protein